MMKSQQLPIDLRPYESMNLKALPAMDMPGALKKNFDLSSLTKQNDRRTYQSANNEARSQKAKLHTRHHT